MEEGLNEKRQPAGLALLLGIASLRPPNQKRSDLFNPFSSSPTAKPKTLRGSWFRRRAELDLLPITPFSSISFRYRYVEIGQRFLTDGYLQEKKRSSPLFP
jgi:hypothetical protein